MRSVAISFVLFAAPGLALAQTGEVAGDDPEAPALDAPATEAEATASDPAPAAQVLSTSDDGTRSGASEPSSTTETPDRPESAAAEANRAEAGDTPAADEEPEESNRPFRGSTVAWTNAMSLYTFFPDATLSYNPTYEMAITLAPRWYLLESTYLIAQQIVSLELTDSDYTSYNHEPVLSDFVLELRQGVELAGFDFTGSVRLAAPVSKASQAASRILQTGAGLRVTREFPEALDFSASGNFTYRRWWATRNVPATVEEYPGNCFRAQVGDPPLCDQASGQTTARDIFSMGLTLGFSPIENLSVELEGALTFVAGHSLAEYQLEDGTILGDDRTHWRNYTYLGLTVGYDVLDWLNLSLGIANAGDYGELYNPDASIRGPINPDTQVWLDTTLDVDSLVSTFE
jgi:hypothetical protein